MLVSEMKLNLRKENDTNKIYNLKGVSVTLNSDTCSTIELCSQEGWPLLANDCIK